VSANRISVIKFLADGLVLVVYIIDHPEFYLDLFLTARAHNSPGDKAEVDKDGALLLSILGHVPQKF
jgi:hypothetical protein